MPENLEYGRQWNTVNAAVLERHTEAVAKWSGGTQADGGLDSEAL